jgi:ketosteroid isomerase-like protein
MKLRNGRQAMAKDVLEIAPSSPEEEIALSYFRSIVTRDFEGMERIFAEDAVQYNPWPAEGFGSLATKSFDGRKGIVDHYRMALANRRDHIFWIDHIHRTQDPNCIIIEAHARSILGETDAVYENEYICVFHIRDGRIFELKEYTNPLAAMRSFAGAFKAES